MIDKEKLERFISIVAQHRHLSEATCDTCWLINQYVDALFEINKLKTELTHYEKATTTHQ